LGRIFTLSGPSGVGKTTFLTALFAVRPSDLVLLPRFTDRPRRDGEDEGFEHFFTSHSGLLQKVFANDFIHVEKWGDYYSAIESRTLEEVMSATADALVLTSVFGSARLRATYGASVVPLYLWTADTTSLMNPRCLEDSSPEVGELKWRIRKKLVEDGFSNFETASLTDDAFLNKRMIDNYLDIAAVNGRLRAGEDILVLPNRRDELQAAMSHFASIRDRVLPAPPPTTRGGGCFVLLPFRKDFPPIFDNHISAVCDHLGITVARADGIFSTRPLMEDIREAVATARVVIADLTDHNPNVFYELGICHALGKNVILITQNREVPSDVRHIRYLLYEYTPPGMQQFEKALELTLRKILAID
jgi:guanylate kinase